MASRNKFSGKALRESRKEAELTQEELALRSGLSRETVSALENDAYTGSVKISVVRVWENVCEEEKIRLGKISESPIKKAILGYFNFL
jgi:DNA-binding XRE family transcriptional regulator